MISYDEELAAKDAEIAECNRKLSAAPDTRFHSGHTEPVTATSDSLPRHSSTTSGSRRGKARPASRPFLWR